MLPTPHAKAFRLALPERDGVTLSELADPWDCWVVSPELVGAANRSSRNYTVDLGSGLTLRRITELDKLRLSAGYGRHMSQFVLEDGSSLRGDVSSWQYRALYARSIGKRWAVGSTFTVQGSEYDNLDVHTHFGPVAEVNLFPYSDNVTAQLRLAYQSGVWVSWYDETTVLGKRRELKPYHALTLVADINKPWGSIQAGSQLSSFIDTPKQSRLSGLAQLSLRLFEGLALNLEGQCAWVHDQIGLRLREVTDFELFLGTMQLPSSFDVTATVGFSYSFGSVHNSIVNPRFGRLDLDDE